MIHDCYTCRHDDTTQIDGCTAPQYLAMSDGQQYVFMSAAIVPCEFWQGKGGHADD